MVLVGGYWEYRAGSSASEVNGSNGKGDGSRYPESVQWSSDYAMRIDREELLKARGFVRAKPGLYIGPGNTSGIPRFVVGFIKDVLESAGVNRQTKVEIDIRGAKLQEIVIRWHNLNRFPNLVIPPKTGSTLRSFEQSFTIFACACETITVQIASGTILNEFSFGDERAPRSVTKSVDHAPDLVVRCILYRKHLGTLSPVDIYRLGSLLRDQAYLRPGLSIEVNSFRPHIRLAFCYPDGLIAALQEVDHSRWPLHQKELRVLAERPGMKLELCLRFVHAGVPGVKSWVNFDAVQSGSQVEGLGGALLKLFPDPDSGCRRVVFVTNSDTGAQILLPHPFVAVMHLHLDEVRYAGPTRDVVDGDDVREFVSSACEEVFPVQWEGLRERRFS